MTETKAVVAIAAHSNFEKTVYLKGEIARNFLTLGRLLKENVDNDYWKILGHDSFEAYVATPDMALSRSYAYQCVKLFKVYVEGMGGDEDALVRIGPSRLIALLPAVDETPVADYEILMSDAEHLSLSDLAEKYGKYGRGKKEGKESTHDKTPRMRREPKDFDEWKLSFGCAICGEDAVERAHLPKSVGAGGRENDWIPLCRPHHREQHDGGIETFAGKYWKDIMMWFHLRLEEACERGDK
jgi:hypothetical protein